MYDGFLITEETGNSEKTPESGLDHLKIHVCMLKHCRGGKHASLIPLGVQKMFLFLDPSSYNPI